MSYLALLLFILVTLSSYNTRLSFAVSPTPKPKALVLPIRQDAATNLLVADIYSRTPLVPVGMVVDLTARGVWVNCETNYKSSTFREPKCGSPLCKRANTTFCHTCPKGVRPFCHANTCGLYVENPVNHQTTIGEVAHDVFEFSSTSGSNPGPLVPIHHFLFTCSPSEIAMGLPKGVQGVAGLAQAPIALQNQIAFGLRVQPTFTLCIPPSKTANGVIFFGSNGPFNVLPGIDITSRLKYTPLTISPFGEYYIKVKSIKFNQKTIPLNSKLLSVSSIGTGGTTLNTLLPYTVLEGSIFKAITSAFANRIPQAKPEKPIAPFGLCYSSKYFQGTTRLGPPVPSFDLELQGRDAVWSIFGLNSLIEAKPGVLCLAFVNGGSNYRAAINIGIYQMQDVPLQFDTHHSRLGFTGPLSGIRTGCSNFNFTSVA